MFDLKQYSLSIFKRTFFPCLLKELIVEITRSSSGRVFHNLGPLLANERSPNDHGQSGIKDITFKKNRRRSM